MTDKEYEKFYNDEISNDFGDDHSKTQKFCFKRRSKWGKITQLHFKDDGYWSQQKLMRPLIRNETTIYYVLLLNCDDQFHVEAIKMPPIMIEAIMMNGKSHYSEEENGVTQIYMIMAGAYGFLFLWGVIGKVPGMLNCALLFQVASAGVQLIHLVSFEKDGEDLHIYCVVAVILEIMAQVFLTLTLTLIAFGYKLTYEKIPNKIIVWPLMGALIFMHLMFGSVVRIDHHEQGKYFQYSGLQGGVIGFFRVILWFIFLFGICVTTYGLEDEYMDEK